MRYVPEKDKEIFAKNSSLGIQIHEDSKNEFSFYVFNRRGDSILSWYKIPLLEHCRNSMQNVEAVAKKK